MFRTLYTTVFPREDFAASFLVMGVNLVTTSLNDYNKQILKSGY